jgi:hypothetical protein
VFEKEGVYLHTNAKRSNQDTTIPGFIRIVERVSWASPIDTIFTVSSKRGGYNLWNVPKGICPKTK